jgi:hypothetical protein
VTLLVAMAGVTRRPLETKDLDNDCGSGDWRVGAINTFSIRRFKSPITVSCNAIGVTAVRALDEGRWRRTRGAPGRGEVAVLRNLSTLLNARSFRASASRLSSSLSAIPRRWAWRAESNGRRVEPG